tara:strand:+ start:1846 stop:2007 length:162 start_codon:yes stop_codon:yes gene_type:complete
MALDATGVTTGATGAISELEEPRTNPPAKVARAKTREIRAVSKIFIVASQNLK